MDRMTEKYIDAKAEGTRSMIEAANAKTEAHLNKIMGKMDVLDEIPKMRDDLADLKLKASNENPRLITEGIAIILGVVGVAMIVLTVFQSGVDLSGK